MKYPAISKTILGAAALAVGLCSPVSAYDFRPVDSLTTESIVKAGNNYGGEPITAWETMPPEKKTIAARDAIRLLSREYGNINGIKLHDKNAAETAGRRLELMREEFMRADDPVVLSNIVLRIDTAVSEYEKTEKNLTAMNGGKEPECTPSLTDIALYQAAEEYYYQAKQLPRDI